MPTKVEQSYLESAIGHDNMVRKVAMGGERQSHSFYFPSWDFADTFFYLPSSGTSRGQVDLN